MWSLLFLPSCLALMTREPTPPSTTRNGVVEGWVDVRVNHFQAHNTDTFPMRYYYNSALQNANSIVIFVGGEWEISPGWVTGGLAYELAERLEGSIFYTEHRYYGQTRPSQNTSTSELNFLTVDQAMGDLAQFIQHVKSEEFQNGRFRNASVALVGCSYAGSMATWMRLAYPHLVDAVFSDSGPLQAQEDFPEYLEVITEALRLEGGEECVASVQAGVSRIHELLGQAGGPTAVSNLFNTCSQLQATPLDLATFFWFGITETFAGLVQYAQPGDVASACEVLTDESISEPIDRLARWVTSQPWTQPCIESRYSVVVTAHTNVSYDAPDATMRLWTYQTCVEYGWFQTTSSPQQPFLDSVPLEYFHQMCRDFFPTIFTEERLRYGVSRTNLMFAGLAHIPDRVVSAVGGLDPWSPVGPSGNHSRPLAPVFMVPGASHCVASGPSGSSNSEELERTKRDVLETMHSFMTDYPLPMNAAGGSTVAITVMLLGLAVTLW